MRAWARKRQPDGSLKWVMFSTLPNGDNSTVYFTWLIQCCSMVLGESPMYGTWGIPAFTAVQQQIPPDQYVQLMQQRFAPYFANLTITRVAANPPKYNAAVLTKIGQVITQTVPVAY